MSRRLTALVALVVGAATLAVAVAVAISEFPRGLILLGCVVVAGLAAWYGALRRGIVRVLGLSAAAVVLLGAVVLLVVDGAGGADLLILVGLVVSLAAARATMKIHVDLPSCHAAQPGGALLQPEIGRREGRAVQAR